MWTYKYCIPVFVAGLIYFISVSVKEKHEHNRAHNIGYEICQIVCVLPLCILIARNEGTRYTYYLQLWWPYVIIFSICVLNEVSRYFLRNRELIRAVVVAVVIVYALWDSKGLLITDLPSDDERRAWEEAYEILDRYGDENILVSSHLSAYCLDNGIPTADYGQAEFNSEYSLNVYRNNKLFMTLFPEAETILENNIEYNALIREKLAEGGFSCIAITDSANYSLGEDEIIGAGYKKLTELDLVASNETLTTSFYVRN
jgi:hypothetical protein